MSKSQIQASNRQGSSTRLTVLLLFLLVVGAGCIYEFAFARPEYQEAWDKVRKVDESPDSSEYTSEQIQEMMGQEPFRTDDSLHENCVVHTYRWRSGLLVKNHDIHVVYTKLNPMLLEKNPELKGKLYYYSASAGQPLDLDTNFPQEKTTIVENLNPPMMSIGGGGGGGQQQQRRQRQNRGEGDDDKAKEAENTDDAGAKKSGEESGDKKSESGEESAEKTTEEKTSETADEAAAKPKEEKKGDADKSKSESTEDKKSDKEKKTDEDESDG